MRVRMRTQYAGPLGSAGAGHLIDVPDVEAWQLIAGRYADADNEQAALPAPFSATIVEPVTVETADAPPTPETAFYPRRGKRRY